MASTCPSPATSTSSSAGSSRWSGGNERVIDVATGTKLGLAVIATLAGLVGIVLAARVYLQKRLQPVEPEILAEGWHYDEAISAFMGGPGQKGFDAVATFDRTVIDGAVNGVAALVRGAGDRLRRVQTGYVRNYALGIAVGVVLLARPTSSPGRPSDDRSIARREPRHRFASSPLTAAIVVPFIGALVVSLIPEGPPELHRLLGVLLFSSATGRAHRLAARRLRDQRRRLPVRSTTTTGSPTSASPGTSASTGSRCSSSCSPACCSRSPSSRSPRTTTRSRTTPGCSCCRPAASACSAPSTCSCSS